MLRVHRRFIAVHYNVTPHGFGEEAAMLFREALESANLMKISLVSATAVLALANTAHTAQAASFPQNGKIAFQSSDRIYTVEPDGSNQRPLTPGLYPNCSPDGTEIVFQGSAREISVMSANGSDIRSITHEANERIVGYWPAWSAEGTVVAFSDTRLVKTGQGGYLSYDIFMLGLDDSEQTNLTNTPKIDEWDADFSPDGSQICFTRSEPWVPEPKHSGIYVMDVHGSDPIPLFESVSQGTCDWAPDGKKIVFSAISDHQKKAPQMEVYIINADGSGLTNLTSNSAMDANPAWSPDGTKIVFSSDRDGGGFDIYTMDADGSDIARVTNARVDVDRPDWQPLTPKSRSLEVRPADTGGPSLLLVASALLFSGGVVFYAGVKRKM
jgi:Tol biopolymer transport system component